MVVKTVLITGFEPFLEFNRNPTEIIANSLNGITIDSVRFIGKILPVKYDAAGKVLEEAIKESSPDLIIGTGLAAGRAKISVEKIAINYKHSESPDNAGKRVLGERIQEGIPDGLFSRIHVEELVKVLNSISIPAEISLSAGAYLCNYVMFIILIESKKLGIPGGFVHVPNDEQLSAMMYPKTYPSISIDTMKNAIIEIAKYEAKEAGHD